MLYIPRKKTCIQQYLSTPQKHHMRKMKAIMKKTNGKNLWN